MKFHPVEFDTEWTFVIIQTHILFYLFYLLRDLSKTLKF